MLETGLVFLCASPIFWVMFPDTDIGGPVVSKAFAGIGVLLIALDVIM